MKISGIKVPGASIQWGSMCGFCLNVLESEGVFDKEILRISSLEIGLIGEGF